MVRIRRQALQRSTCQIEASIEAVFLAVGDQDRIFHRDEKSHRMSPLGFSLFTKNQAQRDRCCNSIIAALVVVDAVYFNAERAELAEVDGGIHHARADSVTPTCQSLFLCKGFLRCLTSFLVGPRMQGRFNAEIAEKLRTQSDVVATGNERS